MSEPLTAMGPEGIVAQRENHQCERVGGGGGVTASGLILRRPGC